MLGTGEWPVDRIIERLTIEYRLSEITKQHSASQDIYQFYGMFGIGKTTLLLAFREIFNKADIDNAYIDLGCYTEPPHQLYIIEEITQQLNNSNLIKRRLNSSISELKEFLEQYVYMGAEISIDHFLGLIKRHLINGTIDEFNPDYYINLAEQHKRYSKITLRLSDEQEINRRVLLISCVK